MRNQENNSTSPSMIFTFHSFWHLQLFVEAPPASGHDSGTISLSKSLLLTFREQLHVQNKKNKSVKPQFWSWPWKKLAGKLLVTKKPFSSGLMIHHAFPACYKTTIFTVRWGTGIVAFHDLNGHTNPNYPSPRTCQSINFMILVNIYAELDLWVVWKRHRRREPDITRP